jgi:PadR family transcriptional regulator PadR
MIIDMSKKDMSKQRADVPYGTLDLLVLKILETMGEMNGYRIARRIEQVSGDALKLSQGAIYPALIRLEQEGWIRAEWGVSETNRKVKFYSLTESGTKQLAAEVQKWEEANALVARFIGAVS